MYFKIKHFKRDFSRWSLILVAICAFVSLPIISIIFGLFKGTGEMWKHIVSYFLLDYVINSIYLILGCSLICFTIGVSSAWVVSRYQFKGRKLVEWLLFMPLSIPSYIVAYTYVGLLGNGGSLINILNKVGLNIQKIEVMNIGGLIWVLSFSLYPYVYAASRAIFISFPNSIKETSFLLGASKIKYFLKIVLPLSSPAIIGGLFLVCMEVLNDYGAAKYFGINTFTTGIFRTWTALEDIQSSIYLCGILVCLVLALVLLVKWWRGKKSYDLKLEGEKNFTLKRQNVSGTKKFLCYFTILTPIIFGFVLPLLQLLKWAFQTFENVFNTSVLVITFQSMSIAFFTSILIIIISILIIYLSKWNFLKQFNFLTKISIIGYVIPGAIIGIAVISNSQSIINFFNDFLNLRVGYLFYSSSVVLVYAYIFRFLAVGFNSIEANTLKLGKNLAESSYLLNKSKLRTLIKIDLPLLKTTIIGAFILVFIDVLKELPLTLILKPYNLQTLAVHAYAYAEDERVAEASIPALLLIFLVGILISIFNISISEFKLKQTFGKRN